MNEYGTDNLTVSNPENTRVQGYPPIRQGISRFVAIGNFDGAHRGHASVAAHLRTLAEARAPGSGHECLALTFDPHPREFFRPDQPHFRLLAPQDRFSALLRIGFDGAIVLPFGPELANMSAADFVSEILIRRLGVAGVAVGEDFHFGKARAGTPQFLIERGAAEGFAVSLVPPFRDEKGGIVSSSAIRKALGEGRLAEANAMLGYSYFVRAEVIHGAKRGRDLGFPTANMRLEDANGLAHGIYAVRATIEGRPVNGVANFGRRPQFDNGAPLLETFLFDFSGDLYGKEIVIAFEAFLRPEGKFVSIEALIEQMNRDCAEARALLGPV